MPSRSVYEINTYEQLRELDDTSKQLDSDVIHLIAEILDCEPNELEEIEVLKKGMTNRSFMFKCRGKRFIMRIPGEGTEMLINRKQEYEVLSGNQTAWYLRLHPIYQSGKWVQTDRIYRRCKML